MTFQYYAETDSLYISLAPRPGTRSEPVTDDIVLDFDDAGSLVGIDIDHAGSHVDLTSLTINSLPVTSPS